MREKCIIVVLILYSKIKMLPIYKFKNSTPQRTACQPIYFINNILNVNHKKFINLYLFFKFYKTSQVRVLFLEHAPKNNRSCTKGEEDKN